MSSFEPEARKRRVVAAVAAAVVLALVVVAAAVVLIGRGSARVDGPVGSSTSQTSQPSASAIEETLGSSTSPGSTSSQVATQEPTKEPAAVGRTTTAPLEAKAESGAGVTVQVIKIEQVKGKAHGPGEIAGPAARVTVQVENGSDKQLSMELALVNAYYGKARKPAASLSGPGADPLAGSIAPGESASGRYVFAVPRRQQDRLTVEFSYTTDAPIVIFSKS